jgi:hypothetical protein
MNENEFGEETITQDGVNPFSEILQRMEETNNNIVVPILKKIESNTAQVRKAGSTVHMSRERAKVVTAVASKATLPGSKGKSHSEAIKSEKTEIVTAEARPVNARNSKGRFVSSKVKQPTQDVNEESGGPHAKKGRLSTLAAFALQMGKSSFKDKKGTMVEAAGRATLGPMFDAVMEVKDQFDNFREKKNNLKEQYGQFKGQDAAAPVEKGKEGKDDTDEIIKSLQKSGKDDEKRHKELVKAILKEKEGQGSGEKSTGLSSPKKTGPGATAREKLKKERTKPQLPTGARLAKIPKMPGGGGDGMLGKLGSMAMKIGPLLAALPLGAITAGVAAVAAVGAAGYSAITGKSNFINDAFVNWTGIDAGKTTQADIDKGNLKNVENTKRINAERRAQGKKELEYDPVTGMVKPGVVDSGKGYTTTVDAEGNVTKKEGARNWRNNNPGNIEYGPFAKKQGATGADGRFAVFPDYKAGRNAKEKLIFEGDKYKNKSLTDAIARYAPPSENNTASYQKAVLASVGGKDKRMSEYTPAERVKIMDEMEKVEGFKQGRAEVIGKVPVTAQAKAMPKPAVATAITAKPAAQEPVATAIATSDTAAKIRQPERIQPAADYAQNTAGSTGTGAGAVQNRAAANNDITVSGLDKLIATLSKNAGKEEERYMKGGVGQIRTEFDDTMLTLMAYDRV